MVEGSDPPCPKNLHGEVQLDRLEAVEALFVEERMKEGLPETVDFRTYEGFKAIHQHLFQDTYKWAGQERTYTTGRGEIPFATPEGIGVWMQAQFTGLEKENFLQGTARSEFAERAAHYLNEVNAAHSFVEGNGRTQRVWLGLLAENAGYHFDLSQLQMSQWYEAAKAGFEAIDSAPMARLIEDNITPIQEHQRAAARHVQQWMKDRVDQTERSLNDEIFLPSPSARLTPLPHAKPSREQEDEHEP